MSRKFPRTIKRVVVKIGSGLIANFYMNPRKSQFKKIISQIQKMHDRGIEVVVVSSGSIILGMGETKQNIRPPDLASLQALAAIGQNVLMRLYSNLFKKTGLHCAQVLLTWDDFDNRLRYNNARNTINQILYYKMIPVINENDTISTDEIKFGDNDRLSALVASLIHADLLIMLSDVDGLYEVQDGQKKVFKEIREVTKEIEGLAKGTEKKHISKGGMITKLEAVKIATHANVPCIIANGEKKNVLSSILKGERIGTFFFEKEEKLLSRRHWISFGAKPKGKIFIDQGAADALLKGGTSLLLPGVVRGDGHFKKEDVVIVVAPGDKEIARGIVNYSISELHRDGDKKKKLEVIHCNNLVLSKR